MISTEESEAAPARPWNRLLRSESTWNRGWRGTVSELSIWDLNWSVVETQNENCMYIFVHNKTQTQTQI